MPRLVFQNERIEDGTANDAAPAAENAKTRITLAIGKDFPDHDIVTTSAFHERDV
ncbi:MAG TPA: hypothetical protein VHF07_05340 [Nitrospiraceae bacterium]|nr:hypothetical protein [Nitrospiraceae bacterium]